MQEIDIQNAFEVRNLANNFTVLLLRLIAKSDGDNRSKLALGYPIEVAAVGIFQNSCPYKELDNGGKQVDYAKINEMAHEFVEKKIGPTGKFPDGKITEDDDGELRIAIGNDFESRTVLVNFGKKVSWIGLDKDSALKFADSIRNHAMEF